jgi:trimethylamine---corrinoid protein Co-methyltransferase
MRQVLRQKRMNAPTRHATRRRAPLSTLTDEQCAAIHRASLDVLERTGCVMPVPEARELLYSAGARVDGERVRIPAPVVEAALSTLRPVTLHNRHGEPALPLAEGRVTFGALTDNMYAQGPADPAMRPFLRSDLAWSAQLLDSLPNIDWLEASGQMHDVPPEVQTQTAFAGAVRHSAKPILVYPYERAGLLDILEAAALFAGGSEALRRKPFVFCASVPNAPLQQAGYNLDVLLACAEYEVPVIYHPHPAMGANSPASIPGTLILANADWLAGVTVHQLARPGAPFCSGGFTELLMDMRTTLWSYCAPEMMAAYRAVADLAHWYGMPAWGIEMLADAPHLDAQAGSEMAWTAAIAFLANIELVHNAGLLGACKVASAAASVWADEQIAYARRALRPLDFTPEDLAGLTGLIDEVGPGGDYLQRDHTLANFRNFWYPQVAMRDRFDPQTGSRLDLAARLQRRAEQLIAAHRPPPADEAVMRELDRLEASWWARTH